MTEIKDEKEGMQRERDYNWHPKEGADIRNINTRR